MTLEELHAKHADRWSVRFAGLMIPDHWIDLVDATIAELRHVDPDVRITSVKEKLNRLVIYTEDMSDERIRVILRGVQIATCPPEQRLP